MFRTCFGFVLGVAVFYFLVAYVLWNWQWFQPEFMGADGRFFCAYAGACFGAFGAMAANHR